MKYYFLSLLLAAPFFLFTQNPDSLTATRAVDSLVQHIEQLCQDRRYNDALQTGAQVLALAETAFGKQSLPYATCLIHQGRNHFYKGEYADAEPFYRESMEIREKMLGRKNAEFAAALYALGGLYVEMGRFAESEPMLLEARDIRAKVLGKEHRMYAFTLNAIALLYQAMERYAEAEAVLQEARSVWEKVTGKNSPEYAKVLTVLGYLYLETGVYPKAERVFLEARSILENTVGKSHPNYALLLLELGNLYGETGRFAEAELLLLEARDITVRNLGTEHPDYAVNSFKLANLYLDMGVYSRAEALFMEAKIYWEHTLGKDHANCAAVINNLSMLYIDMGDYAKAEQLYLEAKGIVEKTVGNDSPRYALSLNNLAVLYRKTGDYTRAAALYREALPIAEKHYGRESRRYASYLGNYGGLHLQVHNYARADSLLTEAASIQRNILGIEHADYARSLSNTSMVYWETNRIAEARKILLELNDMYRKRIEDAATYMSENQFLGHLKTFEKDFARFQSFALFYPHSELTGACYDNALLYRGQMLENARRLNRSVAAADSLTREIFAQWQLCRSRLAGEYNYPIKERIGVAELELEAEGYEKTLTRNLSGFAGAYAAPHWQDVRDRLKPGEAAIEFLYFQLYNFGFTDTLQYAALVLLPGAKAPVFVPLCIQRQLDALLDRNGQSEDTFIENLYYDLRRGAETPLYQLVWKPLEPLLRDVHTIWYAPVGDLHRLNLAAIRPDRQTGRLAERYQMRAVGSTRQLAAAESFQPNPKRACLFGDIRYELDSVAYRKALTKLFGPEVLGAPKYPYLQHHDNPTGKSGFRGEADEWQPLPYSAVELDAVDRFLQNAGYQTQILSGYDASEEAAKQVGHPTPPRMLHFSTHGFFFPDPETHPEADVDGGPGATFRFSEHPLLRSALILCGANYAWKNQRPYGNFEDGILTAYEISQLNLPGTELVVLSACETGLGDIRGHEGVYGLQRAFKVAGARYILMSLWEVPDKAAGALMAEFYQNYLQQKMPVHLALREAQNSLRAQREFESPYFWAGFVVIE
ncbi:MAG: CHAT domain-containing tetratricopeptide repeat protein [Saprospiraceae bacterium]